jgi:hypothetical protein
MRAVHGGTGSHRAKNREEGVWLPNPMGKDCSARIPLARTGSGRAVQTTETTAIRRRKAHRIRRTCSMTIHRPMRMAISRRRTTRPTKMEIRRYCCRTISAKRLRRATAPTANPGRCPHRERWPWVCSGWQSSTDYGIRRGKNAGTDTRAAELESGPRAVTGETRRSLQENAAAASADRSAATDATAFRLPSLGGAHLTKVDALLFFSFVRHFSSIDLVFSSGLEQNEPRDSANGHTRDCNSVPLHDLPPTSRKCPIGPQRCHGM